MVLGITKGNIVSWLSILVGGFMFLLSVYLDWGLVTRGSSDGANKSAEPISDITYQPVTDPTRDYSAFKDREQIGRENATLFMLARNSDLQGVLDSMRQVEDRFNKKFKYPWTFLNDDVFTDEFKNYTRGMASGHVYYGQIPEEHWSIPAHINQTLMQENMDSMAERNVVYGNVLSYRHMCRWNSGFFAREPLLAKYDYYWRVEPDVKYYCDMNYDPFTFMRTNNKMYGFVIAILEYEDTIPTLGRESLAYFSEHPEVIALDSAKEFITDTQQLRAQDTILDPNSSYNLCHFWSNFEIANLNFFRSKNYIDFFEYLDERGGFFYERWGDAPVHTIGLSMMLNRSQIHHFEDVGYRHDPYFRCPHDDESYLSGRCICPEFRAEEIDLQPFSCLPKWWYHGGKSFLKKTGAYGNGGTGVRTPLQ